jgi:hypothetical protein
LWCRMDREGYYVHMMFVGLEKKHPFYCKELSRNSSKGTKGNFRPRRWRQHIHRKHCLYTKVCSFASSKIETYIDTRKHLSKSIYDVSK